MILKTQNLYDADKGSFRPGWIRIEKSKIAELSFGELPLKYLRSKVTDYDKAFVGPSGVDLHVHSRDFNESHKETFETLDAQALKGGIAAGACMANTLPRLDGIEAIQEFIKRSSKMKTSWKPFAAVTKNLEGKQPTDWKSLLKLPVAGLSDDGKPVLDEALFRAALKATKGANKLFSLHEEDTGCSHGSLLHLSETSTRLGVEGSSEASEVTMVERDLRIAGELKASVHFGHLSAASSVKALRAARKKGISFSAELTPHHALLSVEDAESFAPLNLSTFKVCPVIRSLEDQAALRKAVLEGLIDCFATDHAPHSNFEKDQPISCASHGMLGLEFSFSLYNELRLQAKLPWNTFFRAFSQRPAELLGLKGRLGCLQKGAEASILVFDPLKKTKVHWVKSKSHNSPFEGREVRGAILAHYVKGSLSYVQI